MGPVNPYRAPQSERLRALLAGEYSQSPEELRQELSGPQATQYPSWFQNVVGHINPFNAVSPEGYPNVDVAGPVMTGVAGTRNAAKLLEDLSQMRNKDLATTAVNYLKLKYPLLHDRILGNLGRFEAKDLGRPGVGGTYVPSAVEVWLNNLGNTRRLPNYIDSGGHELGHFVRHARGYLPEQIFLGKHGRVRNLKTGQVEEVFGTYEPGFLSKERLAALPDDAAREAALKAQVEDYFNQPAEVAARKAGETAKNTYYNFITSALGKGALTKNVMNKLKIPKKARYDIKNPLNIKE